MNDKYKDFISAKFDEIHNLDKSLKHESDRGCAMLIVSYLDYELKTLLERRFIQHKIIIKNLTDSNRPLGSFSSRIDLSYLIGLISKSMHSDLNLIRKIRNEFAHKYTPITFENSKIKSICDHLYYANLSESIDTRTRFVTGCIHLLSFIQAESFKVIPIENNEDVTIESLNKIIEAIKKGVVDSLMNNKASH